MDTPFVLRGEVEEAVGRGNGAAPETKKCGRCQAVKPLLVFGRDKSTHDGFQSWCKDCVNARARKRYYEERRKVFAGEELLAIAESDLEPELKVRILDLARRG
jgi:hypothetical protein